jgi:hypothetical protein
MAEMAFSNLTRQSLFSQSSAVNSNTGVRKKFGQLNTQLPAIEIVQKNSDIAELRSEPLDNSQEIERAFHAIAAALRTLEIDANMIDSCLARLSPAEREKILTHLQQLKRNKQKTHDLHYHYTEVCLASSQQHFTNGISPRERQLSERIMKLRERIAKLIGFCHELLTQYKLLGKVQLPKDWNKSLAAIKNLGNVLTEIFGGTFKCFANGFKVDAAQKIYIERNGEVYASNVEQLKDVLTQLQQRLTQAVEGTPLAQIQPLQQLQIG